MRAGLSHLGTPQLVQIFVRVVPMGFCVGERFIHHRSELSPITSSACFQPSGHVVPPLNLPSHGI